MNKLLVLAIVGVLVITTVNAQLDVDRQIPISNGQVSELKITVVLTPEDINNFDIAELFPANWQLVKWESFGNKNTVKYEAIDVEYQGEQKVAHHWRFEESNKVMLKFTMMPAEDFSGVQEIIAIYTNPNGFNTDTYTLSTSGLVVKTAECGDNVCDAFLGENEENCPQDCVGITINLLDIVVILIIAGIIATVMYSLREKPKKVYSQNMKLEY